MSPVVARLACATLLLPCLSSRAEPSPYPAVPLQLSSATLPPNVMLVPMLDKAPLLVDVQQLTTQLLGKQYPVRLGLLSYDNSLPEPTLASLLGTVLDLQGALNKRNSGGRLYLEAEERGLVGDALFGVNELLSGKLATTLTGTLGGALGVQMGFPIAESYAELTRYYRGQPSLYNKPTSPLLQSVSSAVEGLVGGLLGASSTRYDSPILYRCQKNFVLLVSSDTPSKDDSFPFNDDTLLSGLPNPPKLDDLAERAYQGDLMTGGTDRDGQSFDAADFPRQNLVTNTIALGADQPLLAATAQKGGGRYQWAKNLAELSTAYDNAMREMAGQGSISVPPVSAHPMSRSVFQASYQSGAWTGRLDVYPVSEAGKIDLAHPVPAKLPAPKDRRIVTTYKGLINDISNLVGAASDEVNPLIGVNLGLGDVLGELFGEPKGIAVSLPTRYQRQLGDIIDSRPETANDGQLVAVGANDGMLHVFKRGGGDTDYTEVLGYIPSAVLFNTLYLARNDYGTFSNPHRYYVNGPLSIEKAGDDSILVGTLAQGGKGLFALKLTLLAGDATWEASDVVLWDKTDKSAGFGHLGHTFGRPIIAKVHTGSGDSTTWAAIVANGYDSAGGVASLFVIDLATGAVIRELTVDTSGGNGLSAPAVLDIDNDDVADVVYAGDLKGDVWRFDLSTAPANWTSRLFWDGSASQPVTSAPVIAAGGSGHTVIFGTGRLLYNADKAAPFAVQAIYGLRDNGQVGEYRYAERSTTLVAQTIEREEMAEAGGASRMVRRVSQNAASQPGDGGWHLELPATYGERIMHSPMLLGDKLFFSTQIPVSPGGKCAPPGDGWIMALDAGSGARSDIPLFDLDGDEKYTDFDRVQYSDQPNTNVASGVQAGLAMPTELTFLGSSAKPVSWQPYRSQDGQINNRANLYTSINPGRLGLRLTFAGSASDTSVGDLMLVAPPAAAQGMRLSWRELF
ncbi:pilus assembly protein [Crenobacter cavernae]|uniref:PilY1 beta-propeller domain-containing protein n=1 Tax=Crenobacter cavernae TaxID=2290923 RepID=A0A345Y5R0_9NEIS|nr:PilC/PilY family type IV pilus protein [Crenobacter cavernae]AXK39262.1 hypothetical protein DWG20_07360 [Crenobacter cavernae]